uniref:GDSL esterase/lipase n=1 Tax=Oryza meridionalis TaxID=40149 RepID=A0A0E0CJC7_9ORYZ
MAALTFQMMLLGGAVVDGGCNDTRRSSVPAIFLFGDGALDVGNNQYLPSSEAGDPIRADHPFYGIDFPGGNATGRYGYTMADFIGSGPKGVVCTGIPKKFENKIRISYSLALWPKSSR